VQSVGKWDFPGIILLRKNPWTALARSTVDRRPLPRVGAHRSSVSSRSGARELRPRGGGGRGEHGVPISGSPGLGRRRSGDTTTVKAAVEERSVRACSGHGERGRRGRGGAVGGADAGAPFYRLGGGAGGPVSERNRRRR
jgi:hypothetical protein